VIPAMKVVRSGDVEHLKIQKASLYPKQLSNDLRSNWLSYTIKS
jgi:hypothetical protein